MAEISEPFEPTCNEDYSNVLEPESMHRLRELCLEEDGWKFKGDKRGVIIHFKRIEGTDIHCLRGRCLFPGITPFQVFDMVSSMKSRHFWGDDLFIKGEIVEQLNRDCQIWYQQFRCPWPITNRDTCTLHQTHKHPDGTYTACTVSRKHPRHPKNSDFIRAKVYPSGFVIVPLPNDERGCMVHYVVMSDPKGWIPKWAVNLNAPKIPLALASIRDFLMTLPPDGLAPPYTPS
eukprot:gnl/Spiro4/16694_TR8981_c0_g1_i1.p1 gnl/Spiro4/16694_TR8981_c0_g1~~gnl/Spiro4/16694_TR8981_c0_g1_i1.p1  ORF type:complete len:252 (+),score=53.95 gnl/Spiro4/16694_TR8981_c0_g1_i1:62-757(+)